MTDIEKKTATPEPEVTEIEPGATLDAVLVFQGGILGWAHPDGFRITPPIAYALSDGSITWKDPR